MVDYVGTWSERFKLAANKLVKWLGTGMSKFYHWKQRHGKSNEHNAFVLRDHGPEDWEKEAMLAFHAEHPL